MKLRIKLILLVASACLLFLGSVGAYFLIQSPLAQMEAETQILQEVDRSTANLQLQTNLLLVEDLGKQEELYNAAIERSKKAIAAIDSIVVLTTVSTEMNDAVNSVRKLGVLADEGIAGVTAGLQGLKDSISDAGMNAAGATWTRVTMAAFTKDAMKNGPLAQFNLANLVGKISILNKSMDVMQMVIQAKDQLIRDGVSKVKAESALTSLVIVLLSLILAMAISYVVARNLTKAMAKIGSTVALVGAGDLRLRFNSRRQDEMGTLGREIDSFLDTLTAAFRRIQEASSENLAVKDQLVNSVSSATSSAVQIEANSESILGQLKKADERIQMSQSDLNMVVILQEAFLMRLGAQNQGVAESTKAVNELAVGIARITELSNQNKQAVEALLAESERGREVFDRSFAKVAEINDSVSAIQDLVGAIAEIAGQTNILALNAAIEAAHAGEAGKGFAVVADEISKLAAASASSSSQIATTIKDVVTKIREAGATRTETLGAFDAIGTQIEKVSIQGRGIYDSADSMNQGTHRIREAMETLSSNADATTQEADRIGSVATKLGDTLGQVGRISHEVVSNIGEITQGLGEISRTVTEVSAQADRLGRVGVSLDEAVNAFQTEGEVVLEADTVAELTPE